MEISSVVICYTGQFYLYRVLWHIILFFYSLASWSGGPQENRKWIYSSVAEAFSMTRDAAFDHRFIFPNPPGTNTLFHNAGKGDPPLLGNLFREAAQGIEAVMPEHFERALEMGRVATQKLTQLSFSSIPKSSCLSMRRRNISSSSMRVLSQRTGRNPSVGRTTGNGSAR